MKNRKNASTPPEEETTGDQETKLKRKDYERELKRLHVELVKLQEWVRHEDQKVCIVFEGRDGAGKGGTIKAITARVSPRIFRVVALACAHRAREITNVYSAISPPSSGGRRDRHLRSQLVQSRRRRAGHGVLLRTIRPNAS